MNGLSTQSRHPWRATARTVVQAILGLVVLLPLIAEAAGIAAVPWVAAALGVVAAVTRVLALPQVDAWLRRWLPWLATSPEEPERS